MQAYTQRLPKLMQLMSGLGLIDRVLAPHGVASAMAGPPSYVVHPTAVLLASDRGIVEYLCDVRPCNEHVQRSLSNTRAQCHDDDYMQPKLCCYVLADGGVPVEQTFDLSPAEGVDNYWDTLQNLACDESTDAGLWPFASTRKVRAEPHPAAQPCQALHAAAT